MQTATTFGKFPHGLRQRAPEFIIPDQIGGSKWVTPMLTIKTNVTELMTSTLNIGLERFIADRLSVNVPISYNPWTFSDNKKIKHLAIQPEFRIWFGESFMGSFINVQSFIGLQLHYLNYNTGGVDIPFGMFPDPENTRYQGQGVGGGLTYANQFGLVVIGCFCLELQQGRRCGNCSRT